MTEKEVMFLQEMVDLFSNTYDDMVGMLPSMSKFYSVTAISEDMYEKDDAKKMFFGFFLYGCQAVMDLFQALSNDLFALKDSDPVDDTNALIKIFPAVITNFTNAKDRVDNFVNLFTATADRYKYLSDDMIDPFIINVLEFMKGVQKVYHKFHRNFSHIGSKYGIKM